MTLTKADFPQALSDLFRPALTKYKCPKCKSVDFELVETSEAYTFFRVAGSKLNLEDGIHEPGHIISLHGRCLRCGHCWKVKKAMQITDAITELDPNTFRPLEDQPS